MEDIRGGKEMNEEFIFCYECEENFHCPDAQRKDGCSWGLKTVSDEDDKDDSEVNT